MAAVAWSSRTRIAASPVELRLRLEDEAALRFVFTDWERAAGVRSNHTAQVEALTSGVHRQVVHELAGERQRARERAVKIPLSDRGWPTITARPVRPTVAQFPLRTIRIEGDRLDPAPVRCTVAPPEEWALLPAVVRGPSGPLRRTDVVRMYRALCELERRGDARNVVVLHLLYGQRSPGADYVAFGELAPIVHMTRAAAEVAARATMALRRQLGSRFVPEALEGEERDVWVAAWAAKDRTVVEPRRAVDDALHKGQAGERKFLRERLAAEAGQLRTRAHGALRSALGRRSS